MSKDPIPVIPEGWKPGSVVVQGGFMYQLGPDGYNLWSGRLDPNNGYDQSWRNKAVMKMTATADDVDKLVESRARLVTAVFDVLVELGKAGGNTTGKTVGGDGLSLAQVRALWEKLHAAYDTSTTDCRGVFERVGAA